MKGSRKHIQRLRNEALSPQDVLTNVQDLAEDPELVKPPGLSLFIQEGGPVQQCQTDLEELVAKLDLGPGKKEMKLGGFKAMK